MGEETIKRRMRRAKERASEILENTGYKIIPSDNSVFCILGVRQKEIRMIRVVVDKITDQDIKEISAFCPPGICTKEIWCKMPHKIGFVMKEINGSVNNIN